MPNDEMKRRNDLALSAKIDRAALEKAIRQQGSNFHRSITGRHAHLFADVPVFVSAEQLAKMEAIIAAVEQVVALPAWSVEQGDAKCKGVFLGYDFHLNESGAHLIEINTNAGGAFLNRLLLQSQAEIIFPGRVASVDHLEKNIVEMFRNEWYLERGDTPLGVVGIVDEQPTEQYLYPEFILAQQMFEQAGMRAVIAAPAELAARADGLYQGNQKIDLIYNRLTDFSLAAYPALLSAQQNKLAVFTPHPQAYSLYADKRNLARLTDASFLSSLGAGEEIINVLQLGVPQTRLVGIADAEQWWAERKQWFFKPNSGYGSKGAYRGEKLTRRVFAEIMQGGYVAQKLVAPGERMVCVAGAEPQLLKYDVRCYVYDGRVQLVAARLYQGQTTNFRTPGGGFAQVRVVE